MRPQLPPRGVRFNFNGGPHDGHVEMASAEEPTSWGSQQWTASEGARLGYQFAVVSELLAQLLAAILERFEKTGELDLRPLDGASAHCFEIVSQQLEDDGLLNVDCAFVGAVPLEAIVGSAPTTRLSPVSASAQAPRCRGK